MKRNYQRLISFFRRYIYSGFGYSVHLQPNILTDKEAGSQLVRDLIQNFGALFRTHKHYVKRQNYFLTIYPFKGLLSPLLLPLLPFAFLHELTHAFAIRYFHSHIAISLLPLLTEMPFLVIALLTPLPLPLFATFFLLGLVGFISLGGDGICFIRYYKRKRNIPNLSRLF